MLQALKWIVHPVKHHVLNHVYVKHFAAGYFNKHPPEPRPPRMTWDIQIVLDYWTCRPDNHALNTLELGQKAVMLILLSTCRRKNEILMLSIDHMYFLPQRVTFLLQGLPKSCSVAQSHPEARWLTIKQFPAQEEPKLCPVRAVATYIVKTRQLHITDKLFISSTPPYGQIAPMTLNRWITTVMDNAGVDVSVFFPVFNETRISI